MTARLPPHDIPDVILLLGTDASGKDHVASVLETLIVQGGGAVEKRRRFFSGKPARETFSTRKGVFDRFQEKVFLALFPRLSLVMPSLVAGAIACDVALYRPPEAKKLIIAGHNGLRALAFHWGHQEETAARFAVPPLLRKSLSFLLAVTGAHVVVLDVDPAIRRARLEGRRGEGTLDTFDAYMVQDEQRSERIEACLVRAARDLLGGVVLKNDNLPDEEIGRVIRSSALRRPLRGDPTP